jgi:DNA-binding HxlR family transcriptional regulator
VLEEKRNLEEIISDELRNGEMTFRDLLKKIPGVTPLTLKLALDALEEKGKLTKFIKNDRYLFGLTADPGSTIA